MRLTIFSLLIYDYSGFAIDANTGSIWPVNLTGSDSYQTYGITEGSGAGGAFVFSLGAHGGFARLYCRKIDPSTGSFVDVHTVDLGNDGDQLLFVHPSGKFLYMSRISSLNNPIFVVAYPHRSRHPEPFGKLVFTGDTI